ncbi:MAG: PKD domain-containing protein [Flavobacteriales bacterium]|nr:PKD domain-containing protein [Flavobacteriales bacterium]MCC6937629.1 PKD domain-containing protein [Flavobacteriales bacterium]
MKRPILATLALLALTTSWAQQPTVLCATDIMRARAIAEDPDFLIREAAFEQELQQLIANSAIQRDEDQTYVIPVVFHIMHLNGRENITNEQVLNEMEILNRDWAKRNADTSLVIPAFADNIANMNIEFKLASIDPLGQCTTGIIRHRSAETFRGESTSKEKPWPRSKYLNVWVVKGILSGAAGYFSGGPPSWSDGIVILQQYVGDGSSNGTGNVNQSRALTHEVGHYLSLAHVWGTNNGVPEGAPPCHMQAVCGDDGVEDTPLTKGWSCCPSAEESKDCDPTIYENYQNYMEYSYCSRMFTNGQRDRARAALLSPTSQRDILWTAANLQATGVAAGYEMTCPPEADFYAQVGTDPTNPAIPFPAMSCTNTNVRFYDNSARAFPTSWSWTFQDGTPSTSTAQNPLVQFSTTGYKSVTLTVTNDHGSTSKTDQYAVFIGGPDVSITPYYESFETMQGEDLNPYVSVNYEANLTSWKRFTGGGATGPSCAMLNSGSRNQLDLIDGDNEGDYDDLVTPLLNLSGAPSAQLSFRYAYSTMTTTAAEITEYLEIKSSTDCGRTWLDRATITGTQLVTNGNNMAVPPQAWTLRTLTLPGSLLAQNVRFRFRYVSSEFSGNLFIDDIWIGVPVGVQEFTNEGFISLFPNPTNDHFSMQVIGMESTATEITITDLRGAVVYRNKVQPNGGAMIELSAAEMGLAEGMYLLRAANNLGSSAQKLIVGR